MENRIRKLLIGCFLFIVLMGLGGDELNNMGLEMIYAEEITSGDWTYEVLEDGTAKIAGYSGEATDITIPEEFGGKEVTEIGEYVFYYNDNIKSLGIHENIKYIAPSSLNVTKNLERIIVDDNNENYKTENGVLFTKTNYLLVKCPSKKKGEYSIPSDVKVIGYEAFEYCSELSSVSIPNGVTEIGDSAFYECSGMTSISIPNSVTRIGSHAFANCSNLTSVSMSDNVNFIGSGAFRECGELISIEIPEGVEEILDNTFEMCFKLQRIDIPESISSIGKEAFMHCWSLQEISLNQNIKSIEERAFYDCESLVGVNIPEGIEIIEWATFADCKNIESVTLPYSLKTIENYAFSSCDKLSEIVIPQGVENIGDGVFSGCVSLENIVVSENNNYYKTIGGVLFDKSGNELLFCPCLKKEYIIPEGVKTIGYGAFKDCVKLANIIMPDTVVNIGDSAFGNCEALTDIDISDSVESIGDSSFWNCKNLKNINIPDKVTHIGEYAFAYCENLQEIEIPKGVTVIESGCFAECINLRNVELPEGIVEISSLAFYECDSLTDIVVKKGIKEISGFERCDNLKSVEIADGLTTIGSGTFRYCENLHTINIPDSVTVIEAEAFMGCTSLSNINLPRGIKYIEKYTFYHCALIEEVIIPEGVTDIEKYAFGWCGELNKVVIPDSVKNIGECAFEDYNTIYSSKNSYAHTYAIENSIPWKDINGTKVSLSNTTIELGTLTYMYDGKPKQPSVTVKYGNNTLVNGTDYTVTYSNNINAGIATVTVTGIGNYTGTVTKTFTINAITKPTEKPAEQQNEQTTTKPAKILLLKQNTSYSASAITLAWDKVSGTTGYEIYRATSKKGKYAKIKTLAKNSFKDTKLKNGKTYYYKVRAYKLVNGTKIYGEYSSVVAMETKTAKPSIKVKAGKKQVKITWNKVSGSNGYEVYMSTSKSGKYKKIKSANAKTTSFTKKKLTEGKKYYFKVRTYKKINGKKIYSSWSVVKSVKVK